MSSTNPIEVQFSRVTFMAWTDVAKQNKLGREIAPLHFTSIGRSYIALMRTSSPSELFVLS